MSADETVETIETVDFYFDPACPWTWLTSRWLVDVAEQRALDIDWRSLSLSVINAGREVPDEHRARLAVSAALHRVMAALRADGRVDLIGDVYTEYGRRVHHDQAGPSLELLRDVLETAGASAWASAIDADDWDDVVVESTREACGLAGPDVGSPVIAVGEPRVAFFGPIVSPPPVGDDAVALFDHIVGLAAIPGVYEIKRGRSGPPEFGPRP